MLGSAKVQSLLGISPEEYRERKKRVYDAHIALIDEKLSSLENDSLPDYFSQLQNLELQRQQRISNSKWLEEFRIQAIHAQFEEDALKIKLESEEHRLQLRGSFLQELEEQKFKLKDRLDNSIIEEADNSGSREIRAPMVRQKQKLRKRADDDLEMNNDRYTKVPLRRDCTKNGALIGRDSTKSGPTVVWELKDSEIDGDLSKIGGNMKARGGPRGQGNEEIEAFYQADTLFYAGKGYVRDVKVTVEYQDVNIPKTTGVITSITHSEVWLRRLDLSRIRLYISQLSKGKYSIRAATGREQ